MRGEEQTYREKQMQSPAAQERNREAAGQPSGLLRPGFLPPAAETLYCLYTGDPLKLTHLSKVYPPAQLGSCKHIRITTWEKTEPSGLLVGK